MARRAVGWAIIIAGYLIALSGFAHLCFMALRSGGSVWNVSPGRWDDYLLILACLIVGAMVFRAGDRLAGWPIRTRRRAAFGAEASLRTNGCLVFFIGIALLALILFMAVGGFVDSGGREWGSLFIALWALPLLWIMRAGWRRFSGRGWLGG